MAGLLLISVHKTRQLLKSFNLITQDKLPLWLSDAASTFVCRNALLLAASAEMWLFLICTVYVLITIS